MEEMIAACVREGAVAAAMTGSGSAVFGLFREAVAAKAARKLQRPDWLVLFDPDPLSPRVRTPDDPVIDS